MDSESFAKTPTQIQIMRALKQVPVLQQQSLADANYVGLKVYWRTRFFDINDIGRGSIKQFGFSQRGVHRYAWLDNPILAYIDIDRYPETRNLMRGHPVDLWGQVSKVDPVFGVTLNLLRFEIRPAGWIDRYVMKQDRRI